VIGAVPGPTAVLIQPDGYVAWVGDLTQLGLADAITTWFGPPTTASRTGFQDRSVRSYEKAGRPLTMAAESTPPSLSNHVARLPISSQGIFSVGLKIDRTL
jgi:hypothetical protein